MDYANIFLAKADELKYQVYMMLARLGVNNVTVSDLSRLLGWRYQLTYNVLQEVLDDLEMIKAQPRVTLRDQLLAAKVLPVSLEAYRSYLARNSLVFQLLMTGIQSPVPSLNRFVDDHYVSISTVMRRLRPANALMTARFGIKFQTTKMNFVGSEANVCYFLFTLMWWAYRNVYWPFPLIDPNTLTPVLDAMALPMSSPLQTAQNRLLLAIVRARAVKIPQSQPTTVDATEFLRIAGGCLRFEPDDLTISAYPQSVQTTVAALLTAYQADERTAPISPTLAGNLARLCTTAEYFGHLPPQPSEYLDARQVAYDPALYQTCETILGSDDGALVSACAELETLNLASNCEASDVVLGKLVKTVPSMAAYDWFDAKVHHPQSRSRVIQALKNLN